MLKTKLVGVSNLYRTSSKSLVSCTSVLCKRGYADDRTLREVLADKIPKAHAKLKEFKKQHGNTEVGKVTINMLYGGMRGLLALVTETSALDPDRGITFRGYDIPELQKRLPKADGGESPLPEGIFWLMCTGDIPTKDQVNQLSCEWADRSEMPKHVVTMLKNLPKTLHPMAQFSAALTVLNHDSKFAKAYTAGVHKTKYWECVFEDCMDLLAKLPELAATIYVNTYKDGQLKAKVDPGLDWSGNLALMMGYKDPKFTEMLRLYNTIHVDHGRGNVSAHTTHLVGSALSDPYLSVAAGMNGLAGPLHGLANQEVLLWLDKLKADVGSDATEEKVKQFVEKTLKSGQVVPGFGHAVLRKTDPRYMCQREFALKHLPNDELFKLVSLTFKVVPPILEKTGKVKNPWPNVDAHSGCLLQHYGMKESLFYTVLFGVSRCLGVLASGIWDRGLMLPIERPKSLTTIELVKMMEGKSGGGKDGQGKKKCC